MAELLSSSFPARAMHRRAFFRVAGAAAATSTLLLAGCDDDMPTPEAPTTATLTLAAGDNGLLNYAYLLEQLEAAFYEQVVTTPPAGLSAADLALLTDLRDHELIHREYLKFALGTNAYDNGISTPLAFDFSSFTLTTPQGVWAAAKTLEEVGVAAYNGAAKLVASTPYLLMLSKISSVEARHATVAREKVAAGSFADNLAVNGLDDAKTPAEVIALVQPYIPVTVLTTLLPTT